MDAAVEAVVDAAVDVESWTDFGVGVLGASAALAGLLIVAVSINVGPILSSPALPERVAGALVMLTTPMVVSVVLLVPGLEPVVTGTVLLAVGLASGLALGRLHRPSMRSSQRTVRQWLMFPVLPSALVAVPVVLAGTGVLTGTLGGLYWLPVTVVAAVLGGLAHAWVLLIEILR